MIQCWNYNQESRPSFKYINQSLDSILNDYSLRQVTNDRIGIPRWKKDKIKEFLEKGDPNMELVASRIVEKFTIL